MPTADATVKLRERGSRLWLCIGVTSLSAVLSGCGSRDPNPFYSGDFVVFSEFDRTIRILNWEGFGGAQPARGNVLPQAECSSFFPKLDQFPQSTTVRWQIDNESTGPPHSQTIDLTGVVPANTAGTTEFLFGADGVWTVRFARSDP